MNELLAYLKKNAKKYSVLVAEDNETALKYISEIIGRFFEKVYIARDGEEAFEIFKNNHIDIIITDINMPKKNGIELIEDIRKCNEKVKIIIISAYNEDEYFQKAIEENVDGYIIKPIDLNKLLKILFKTVNNLKLEKEKNKYLNLLMQYEEIVNKSAIFAKVDKDRNVEYVNDELVSLTGFDKENFLNKPYKNFIEFDEKGYEELYNTVVENKSIFKGILKLKTKKGDFKYIKFIIKPILNEDEIEEFILVGYDVSAIMNPKKLLLDKIEKTPKPYLALFKIENYYDILSLFGEKISEEFEKQVYLHIKKLCNGYEVFLLDNGEVGVFVNGNRILFSDFINFIENKLKKLNQKIVILDGISYDVFLIVSVAKFKNCFDDCKIGLEKLKNNNLSLINATGFYQNEKNKAKENLYKLNIIKNAINNDKVFCMYQPIINNKTLKTEKHEALVRIKYENQILTPYHFLDIAKKSSFYTDITKIVLEKTIDFINNSNENISVNISSIDIEKTSVREEILRILKEYSYIAKRLTFELLESEEIEKNEEMKNFIKEIKNYGAQIAIDDFGSGYSNFIRLLNYEPDFIKIDGSIIKEIDKSKFAYNVAEIIVKFAKRNRMQTIAEFVENEFIFNKVKELGIDYSQGYFFSKPLEI